MASLSDGPQKINGLAGITLAAYVACYCFFFLRRLIFVLSIIQALATLIAGFTIGVIYIWKVGLVGFGKSNACQVLSFHINYLMQHVSLSSSLLDTFVW